MAAADDISTLNGILKTVYGNKVHQAVPDNTRIFYDLFPFEKGSSVLGAQFNESINVGIEQGVTRVPAGTTSIQTMATPIASQNVQATVNGAEMVVQASVAWSLVSKAKSSGPAAFENAMKRIVDNALLSHRKAQVSDMLYGGTSLATIGTGATSATQTISTATCAPGLWYGQNGALFDIWDPTYTTKRNSSAPLSLATYSVSPQATSKTLTFNASVATTTGDVVVFSGTVASNAVTTPTGLVAIANSVGGTLFGVNQTTYPVYQSWQIAAGGNALSQKLVDEAITNLQTAGYTGKMKLLCNPLGFSNLAMEQAARIQLINGQSRGSNETGYNKVAYVSSTGANVECEGSPYIMEGSAYLVPMDGTVKRIGAVDIQLGGPSDPYPSWQRIPGEMGYSLMTYSLQAMFTPEPQKIVAITGITNT